MWKQPSHYTTTEYVQLQFYWVHPAQTNALAEACLSGFIVLVKLRDCAAVKFHNISLIGTLWKHLFRMHFTVNRSTYIYIYPIN